MAAQLSSASDYNLLSTKFLISKGNPQTLTPKTLISKPHTLNTTLKTHFSSKS